MGKLLEDIYNSLPKSRFNWVDENKTVLEVTDALIFWKHFNDTPNQFGSKVRYFCLALPDDVGDELSKRGWKVKDHPVDDPANQDCRYIKYISVKINMASDFPPTVVALSEYKGKKSRVVHTEATLGELDRLYFKSACVKIRAYPNPRLSTPENPKITAYLSKALIEVEPVVEFNGFYDDWDNPEVND